jgi:hypothetical protein
VPKRDLITGLQVVIEQRRLEVAPRSRGAAELMAELAELRGSLAASGRPVFGGDRHDDLAMALALAWWWVRKGSPRGCWGVAA